MTSNEFQPLAVPRRDVLIRGALGGAEPGGVLYRLDCRHAYLRWHGSPSEEARAIQPMGILLGVHLASVGWTWAETQGGVLAMVSPDARRACLLSDVVCGLLERDDTNFSWFVQRLSADRTPTARGVVSLAIQGP